MGDIVRVRYTIVDAALRSEIAPALREALGAVRPAATMVVAGLNEPEMKVEIEVTALPGLRCPGHSARENLPGSGWTRAGSRSIMPASVQFRLGVSSETDRQRLLVAAAAIAAGVALSAGGAAAQGLFGGGSWYVKGFGGATLPQDDDFELDSRGGGHLRFRTRGSTSTLAMCSASRAATCITPNVAVELEYAYRNADAELQEHRHRHAIRPSRTPGWRTRSTGSTRWAWAPPPSCDPTPAAGSGRPTSTSRTVPNELGGGDFDSDYKFAYQLIGGVAYDVNPNFSITTEVRFFGINEQDLENETFDFKNNVPDLGPASRRDLSF